MSLAPEPYRARVAPVPVVALSFSLPHMSLPGKTLHFLTQRPPHLGQSHWDQRLDQFDAGLAVHRLDCLPVKLTRLAHPPVLLASTYNLWHPLHRWPPSSFWFGVVFPHPPYLRSEVTSIPTKFRTHSALDAPVLALDVPSGIDASTGAVFDPAIRAAATMTLALPKTGLRAPSARDRVGELYLADIGAPRELFAAPTLRLSVGVLFAHEEVIRLL